MKFKRFWALALAGVMTLGMAANVMADDKQAADLTTDVAVITKNLEYEKDYVTLPADTKFQFKFEQVDNAQDEPAKITNDLGTLEIPFDDGTESATLKLNEEQIATFTTPGVYTYKITELGKSTTSDFGMTYNTKGAEYTMRVLVKNDGKVLYTIKNKNGVKEDTATFDNKYVAEAGKDDENKSFSVEKKVTSPEWATVNEYDFAVTFKDSASGKTSVDHSKYTVTGANVTWEGNTAKFKLAKDAKAVFDNIPAGIQYEVVETPVTSLSDCTALQNGDSIGSIKDESYTVRGTLEAKGKANTVQYTNIFQNIDPTGLALNIAPFVAMFAAVGAAIAMYVAAKRRVR